VDIVPANCNCSGTCAVNETEDMFECFCPDNTTLAQDGFDCLNSAAGPRRLARPLTS
jgi:hypothetical protein